VLAWNTAVPASTYARYGLTSSYGTHTNTDVASGIHVTVLSNLAPGTQYHFRLVAKDAMNLTVIGPDELFTTQSGPVSVSVSPASGTLTSGASQQFIAQVTNASNTCVTWAASAGSITAAGLFTAPVVSSTQNVLVTATSVADPTKLASAAFTVTAPILHSVTLNWKASTSSNVVAYNTYRSLVSGGPYGLLASTISGLSYIDQAVQSGTTYYYVVTAVNSSGEESADSGQASARVPTP
jgi:hypothetical protein